MSSLADYLAKNYLTADPLPEGSRPKKKRKKRHAQFETEPGGLIIADDDPPSLRASHALDHGNDDDENSPSILNNSRASAEFRRKKKSSWKTVGGTDQAEADAILASAAAESVARADADDDAPTVENTILDMDEGDAGAAPRMESGMRAGLQTAAQTAAMVAAQERRKKADAALYKPATTAEQETIYRDASGRIINVAMKRAEARRAAEEAKEKEERAKDALMGDVQRQQKDARRQELREARAMPLARTVEDEAMNEELKAQERWNDPAAQFLTTKRDNGVSRTGRPIYTGGFAPNRYGIRPGHRWDGVDRSTGFEKEWFQARTRKERVGALEYAWQMDE